MTNLVQRELDKAEEYVFRKLFGSPENPVISQKLRFIMIAKQINFDEFINEKIKIFEMFASDFMDENGFFRGKQISQALILKFPALTGLELPDVRPLELVEILDELIGFDKLGKLIQEF